MRQALIWILIGLGLIVAFLLLDQASYWRHPSLSGLILPQLCGGHAYLNVVALVLVVGGVITITSRWGGTREQSTGGLPGLAGTLSGVQTGTAEYQRAWTTQTQVRYGVISLPEYGADSRTTARLALGIENGLHYRRDVTSDAKIMRNCVWVTPPRMLAVLNNLVLGLFARQGETHLAHARRHFASHFDKALATLAA